MLRVVATNQVEIGDVALGFVAGDVPELNAFSMPFACTSMDKFYDNAVPAMSGTVEKVMLDQVQDQPGHALGHAAAAALAGEAGRRISTA